VFIQFSFSTLNTAPDFPTRSRVNSFSSSSSVNISLSSPGFQPRSATKFTSASGKKPLFRYSSTATSPCRLLSFDLSGLRSRGRCANRGGPIRSNGTGGMFWCAREPFLAPDDVGDTHQVVIHDVCQMVGGIAVGFQEDLVVESVAREFHDSADDVIEGDCLSGGIFMRTTAGVPAASFAGDLFRRQIQARLYSRTATWSFSCFFRIASSSSGCRTRSRR
jgi:hypothetical protein